MQLNVENKSGFNQIIAGKIVYGTVQPVSQTVPPILSITTIPAASYSFLDTVPNLFYTSQRDSKKRTTIKPSGLSPSTIIHLYIISITTRPGNLIKQYVQGKDNVIASFLDYKTNGIYLMRGRYSVLLNCLRRCILEILASDSPLFCMAFI